MSAEQTPAIERVLAEHGVSAKAPGDTACRCDRRWRSDAAHRAHVAQALAPVLDAAVREAEQRAWDEGYGAAEYMARCWGHTDSWEDEPENPYRPMSHEGGPQ